MIFHHFNESDQTYLISARHSRILRILIHPKLPIKNPDSLRLLKYTGIKHHKISLRIWKFQSNFVQDGFGH